MKFAVVVFPGSNCDHDAYHAAKHVLGQDAEFVWHKETSLQGRGRRDPARRVLARRLPAHRRDRAVLAGHGRRSASSPRGGGPVLGICNGFQVLLEAGCCRARCCATATCKFHCEHVHVRVEQTDTPFTARAPPGQVLQHADRARRRQLLRRRPTSSRELEANRPGRLPLLRRARRGHRRRQPERLAQQHRRHLQRARATSSA